MKWAKFKGNEITYLVRWIVGIFFLLPISTIYFLLFLIDTPIHFARNARFVGATGFLSARMIMKNLTIKYTTKQSVIHAKRRRDLRIANRKS